MEKVERRTAQPAWIRVWTRRPDLIRTIGLSFALALLVLLPVLNPLHWASEIIEGNPVVRVGIIFAEVIRSILFETKLGQLPIAVVLATVASLGYLFCVGAALAVQRLSTAKR
jgi:hypothetical protein